MSDKTNSKSEARPPEDWTRLEAENQRLERENQRLVRLAQDVAAANAHAAELMVQVEEANEKLETEIEKRKTAEEELQRANRQIEATVQRRTSELTTANEKLSDEVGRRIKIEKALREQTQRLDKILSSLLTGVVIVDSETHEIVDVNPMAAKIIGLPKEEIIGKVCHKLICSAERDKCPISDLGETVDQSERVVLNALGQRVPILKTVTTAFWQGREYLVESFIDISDRKLAEVQRTQLLEKLEKANRELQDFAYIVAHDLKAPLRGIKTLVDWMFEDTGEKFDDAMKTQMNLLSSRVSRMHDLIGGILQYSRIGRTQEETVTIDLDELIPEIIDGMAPPEHIHITIDDPLPRIQGQVTRLTQVFQNLISNAVKYMDKPEGRIRVGCTDEDGFWKFTISDNGPGIEEKYFEKIFQIFQTLSSRDEFENTGVGLTVVKKIIELYGGRIWVESQAGQGSTFLFTLPKQEAKVEEPEKQSVASTG